MWRPNLEKPGSMHCGYIANMHSPDCLTCLQLQGSDLCLFRKLLFRRKSRIGTNLTEPKLSAKSRAFASNFRGEGQGSRSGQRVVAAPYSRRKSHAGTIAQNFRNVSILRVTQ